LSKNPGPAHADLALLYATAEDPKYRDGRKAMQLVEKAVKLGGGNAADILQQVAQVQYALDRRKDAIRTLNKALALDPGNREYLKLLRSWGAPTAPTEISSEPLGARSFSSLW